MTAPSDFKALVYTRAKLNLSLKIFSPRSDSFHPICSIFQTLSLSDTLTITPLAEKKWMLSSSHPDFPLTESNILTKIYRKFESGLPFGFHIHVEKNIPFGSGLGGASTNAAGFLLYLNRFLKKPRPTLIKLSTSFGADIPFFIHNTGTALVRGIGEKITPISPGPYTYFVLIFPGFSSSTPEAYRILDKSRGQNLYRPTKTPKAFLTHHIGENDFKTPLFSAFPQLNDIEEAGKNQGYFPLQLSGSGSTVFYPFHTKKEAELCLNHLKKHLPYHLCLVSTMNKAIDYET